MGGFGWQDAIVVLGAVAALTWLVLRRVRRRRPTPFCDDCPACDPSRSVAPPPGASAAPDSSRLIPESDLFRR